MAKSIIVIDEEELTFLKQITNHFTDYNTSKTGVSVVNKIRNAQDTTELLEAISKIQNKKEFTVGFLDNRFGANTFEVEIDMLDEFSDEWDIINKALGGQDE